jgi:hypothetical protein
MHTLHKVDREPRHLSRRSVLAGAWRAALVGIGSTGALSGCASTRSVDADACPPAEVGPTPPAATAHVSEFRPHARRRVVRGK